MASLSARRGKKAWRGSVMVKGTVKAKWFPDATRKSERAAILWEEETRAALVAETKALPDETPLTCWEWSQKHLEDLALRKSSKTLEERKTTFRFFFRGGFDPEMPVEVIDYDMAKAHLDAQASARSGNAANKDRSNLSRAWRWAMKNMRSKGFPQAGSPFEEVETYKHDSKRGRYVPPEEDFWAVYETLEGQDRVMLTSFLHLAARRGELFRLTWRDVNFPMRQVTLKTKKTKDGSWREDVLPMTKELQAALLAWWEERENRRAEHVFTVLDSTPFTNQFEGQPFTVRQHFMNRACGRAGVRPFGYHAIRHLSATILYKAGYKVAVIQAILRHESPRTTERYLRNLGFNPEVEAAVEAFENRGPAKVIDITKNAPGSASSGGVL